MGVKNLWDILESCKKTLPLHHLENKRVCVDLSCWIVQLHTVNKSHCPTNDKVYLKSLFHRLKALIALNCSIIFVADGAIPAIKVSTYRRRLNVVNEPILDPYGVSSVKRPMGSAFSCMIKEAKLLGMALGIPCLDGIEEAEAQCALLNSELLCDGCYSSDSDAFLFGARTVYRDICLSDGGYVVCYEMGDIETKLGFGRNSLIALAILLGSDYTQRIRGFGPESACKIVKFLGDAVVLQKLASEVLATLKKGKVSNNKDQICISGNKENVNCHYLNSNESESDLRKMKNHFNSVITAYLKPECHSADSDDVVRVLALYPFNNSQLHEICARFFKWPPEMTDEYILPKIAERSLRRFANLRSSSSQLGVNPPVDEMPVKCPVSCIIKQRKIQGILYYEVSWIQHVHSPKASSTVPADLVQSACPEKVLEFLEKKAKKSKAIHRDGGQKKSITKEIDEKLNMLILEIEQESTSHRLTELCSRGKKISHGDGFDSCMEFRKEIIDLTSPAPRVKEDTQDIHYIELSDSEVEDSPQHTRKLKDLRVFISSVG